MKFSISAFSACFLLSPYTLTGVVGDAGDSIADGSFKDIHTCSDGTTVTLECDWELIKDSFESSVPPPTGRRHNRQRGLRRQQHDVLNTRSIQHRNLDKDEEPFNAFEDLLSNCKAEWNGTMLRIMLAGQDKLKIEEGDNTLYKYVATVNILEDPTFVISRAEGDDGKKSKDDEDGMDPEITTLDVVASTNIAATDAGPFWSNSVKIEAKGTCNDPEDVDETCTYGELKVEGWGAC